MEYQGNKHTSEQLKMLIEEAAKNPTLADDTIIYDEHWRELADRLNALAGPPKTVTQWRTTLRDWKELTDRIRHEFRDDPIKQDILNELFFKPLEYHNNKRINKFQKILGKKKTNLLEDVMFKPTDNSVSTAAGKISAFQAKKMERDRKRNQKMKRLISLQEVIKATPNNESICIHYPPSKVDGKDANAENQDPPANKQKEKTTGCDSSREFFNKTKKIVIKTPSNLKGAAGKRYNISFDGEEELEMFLRTPVEDLQLNILNEVSKDLELGINSVQERIGFIKDMWKHRCGAN